MAFVCKRIDALSTVVEQELFARKRRNEKRKRENFEIYDGCYWQRTGRCLRSK